MVALIESDLKSFSLLKPLNEASDNICNCNTRKYLDFDDTVAKLHSNKIFKGNTFASCDVILFSKEPEHLFFVEFKDMNSLNSNIEVENWWKSKNRSVYLKMTDSILSLSYYLDNKNITDYNTFMNIPKSFFYVYKSISFKSQINTHLKNKFSRYDFIFKNIRTIETNNFETFLNTHNL